MDINDTEPLPLDSFAAVYRVLVWTGFYKPLKPVESRAKQVLHTIYRAAVIIAMFLYTLQYVIFAIQMRQNMEKVVDCLVIGIPQFNLLTKLTMVHIKASKIASVNEGLKRGEFLAPDAVSKKYLNENKKRMFRLMRIIVIDITVASVLWPLAGIVQRYYDPNDGLYIYTPYKTDTWPRFFLGLANQSCLIFWMGYGHLSIDALIVSFYSQAQTQLRIMKHQLEHLVEDENTTDNGLAKYKDLANDDISNRFRNIIHRYGKIYWYLKEVNSIFNVSLFTQFLTSSGSLCFVIYRMTKLRVTSLPFAFLVVVCCNVLMQVFLYCYFGNLVEHESKSINTSLYKCNWLCLSPSFRRNMLIVMSHWCQPLRPTVATIIPLSMPTFLAIVKSSYTLYTVLVTTKVT